MSLGEYAGYLSITVLAIVFVLRAVFFLLQRVDPIKAIVPRWPEVKKKPDISQMS